MAIVLYPHNENAYPVVLAMLRETGKAAVIHPTGTGKSFIGFKLCEDFPEKRICWLSPSEYIFRTQLENLAADSGMAPENITFFTYARLMAMDADEIAAVQPGYIILDEFHRCGAEQWGQGIRALLSAYPDVPLLGLSATNIRFLDNQRDMAKELFDGHIASEISLGEAIAREILKPPKYVLSVYSFQKDLERYEGRVEKLRNPALRDRAEELLKTLRRSLENSDGLDIIFARHMPDRHGKYIVFCSNVTHMNRMIGRVPNWFSRLDSEPHIYHAYSPDPETRRAFAAFREDESNHLKLLFTIDMLNEGVHIADVDGVILFRPTVSPIIYKQQIGRALSAGSVKAPVIFDVVNNIENLCSIGAVEREFEEAVLRSGGSEREREELRQRFQIIDEVRDCRRLFERLNDTLTASWDEMYGYAKAYYEKMGHLQIPKTYRTEDGHSLGLWLRTQRAVRKGVQRGVLSEERIAKLDEIGMCWTVREQDRWPEYFAAAEAYAREFGNLCVPYAYVTPDGMRLGKWLGALKAQRKRHESGQYLTRERIAALDRLGMVWDVDKFLWEQKYEAARRYFQENGNLQVPIQYTTPDGTCLGAWIRSARNDYKSGRLDEASIRRLEAIGMVWDVRQTQWDRQYQAAQAYYREHGHLRIAPGYVTPDGKCLGTWIQRVRQWYKQKKLTADQIKRLEAIGMIWDGVSDRRERNYQAALAYYREHGDLKVPTNYVNADGLQLGWWVRGVRKAYQKGTLDREQIDKLESIGMLWSISGQSVKPGSMGEDRA